MRLILAPLAGLAGLLAALQGCTGITLGGPNDNGSPQDNTATTQCAPGEVIDLAHLGQTEGLAFGPDGRLYAGSGDSLWVIAPDGSTESLAAVDGPIGVGVWGNAVAVAQWGLSSDVALRDGAVALVDLSSRTVSTFGEGTMANPNAVVATAWGTLLVSDDFVNDIYEVTADNRVSVWTTSVESPNGMVFSSDGRYLYVNSTFTDTPVLNRIQLQGQSAGERTTVASFAAGTSPDGVARDSWDRIYSALNTAGQIVRYDPRDGSVTTVAQDLLLVASIAIPDSQAVAQGYDACSLYAVQLRTGQIWQVPTDLPPLATP